MQISRTKRHPKRTFSSSRVRRSERRRPGRRMPVRPTNWPHRHSTTSAGRGAGDYAAKHALLDADDFERGARPVVGRGRFEPTGLADGAFGGAKAKPFQGLHGSAPARRRPASSARERRAQSPVRAKRDPAKTTARRARSGRRSFGRFASGGGPKDRSPARSRNRDTSFWRAPPPGRGSPSPARPNAAAP